MIVQMRQNFKGLCSSPIPWTSLYSALQSPLFDSAGTVLESALNFRNNLLWERIWKQFVIMRPSLLTIPPPPSFFFTEKVIVTIDLSSTWMAFSSIPCATVITERKFLIQNVSVFLSIMIHIQCATTTAIHPSQWYRNLVKTPLKMSRVPFGMQKCRRLASVQIACWRTLGYSLLYVRISLRNKDSHFKH